MPKRKRANSMYREEAKPKKNPFLAMMLDEKDTPSSPKQEDDQQQLVLEHVLAFSDYASKRRTYDDDNSVDGETSLTFLLNYLERFTEREQPDQSAGAISTDEIALLILPWTVKKILSPSVSSWRKTNLLDWRAASVTLRHLTQAKDPSVQYTLSQQVLTQSTLYKLCPKVALLALIKTETDDSDSQTARVLAASVFTLLAQDLFRPTLDVAAKSLLIPLATQLPDAENVTTDSTTETLHATLLATLRLLLLLLQSGKGNPRTTFQLFASKDVLLALASLHSCFEATCDEQAKELIMNILSNALFHPRHHMDGFYSLLHKAPLPRFESGKIVEKDTNQEEIKAGDNEKKFRSYQEELITSVNEILRKTNGTKEHEPATQEVAIHLVPLLLECFLNQSRVWDIHRVRDNKKRKSSREDELAHIQFQLFATWTVPLQHILLAVSTDAKNATRESISSGPDIIQAALKSLKCMLNLVLEHDTYTPSQHDSQNMYFSFLMAVTKQILALSSCNSRRQSSRLADAIPTLVLLLQLNHLLVHDKAKEMLMFCVQDGSRDATTLVGAAFTAFFETYRKLRQQSFAVSTVLDVLDAFCAQKETNRIQQLGSLLLVESVASSIAVAVQECPIDQAKEILDKLDAWIQGKCSQENSNSMIAYDDLSVVSELVLLATRNIRVERATASVVSDILSRFMDGAVLSLENQFSKQPRTKSASKLKDVTMKICAWLLELHGRCTFWLGKSARLEIPDRILAILQSSLVSRSATEQANRPGTTDGVILLGCHQLRQLHSLIHEQPSLDLGGQDEKLISRILEDDAKRLISAISLAANASKEKRAWSSSKGSQWSIVAEHFVFWAHYAEDKHMFDFLTWVCRSLSLSNTCDCTRRDIEIAKALLSDASFLENERVRAYLSHCALLLSIDMIVEIAGQSDDRCTRDILKTLQAPTKSNSLLDLLEPLGKEVVIWKGLPVTVREELGTRSRKVAQLVSIVTGLPLTNHPSVVAQNIRHCCTLDFAFRSMATLESQSCWQDMVSSINCLRGYLCGAVKSAVESSVATCINGKRYVRLLEHMLKASVSFFSGNMICDYTNSFYSVTGELLESLVQIFVASNSNVASLDTLIQSFTRAMDVDKIDTNQLHTLVLFGSSITEIILKNDGSFDNLKDSLQRLVDQLWKTVRLSLEKGLDDHFGALYLASDLFQLRYQPSTLKALEERLETRCVEILESNKEHNKNLLSACSSVLGSMAMSTNQSVRDKIFNIVIRNERRDPVLEATFCHSVQLLSANDLAPLMEKILSAVDKSPKPMLLFVLLLQNLTERTQIEVLSTFSRRILTSVLTQLGSRQSSKEENSLNTLLILLDEMVQRRDILVFRELDLVMVLTSVASVLAKRDPTTNELASSSFALCCTLVTSMQQRYSKLLYACVPSVVMLFSRLMEHAMFWPDDNTQDKCTRNFTRICEILVPHKDVYKKHVLGLVLEFVVRGLPKMTLSRREALTPAMYFLLDILSTYETQQLHACMDTQHRMQFRAIYQGHQRVHSYKGQ